MRIVRNPREMFTSFGDKSKGFNEERKGREREGKERARGFKSIQSLCTNALQSGKSTAKSENVCSLLPKIRFVSRFIGLSKVAPDMISMEKSVTGAKGEGRILARRSRGRMPAS